MANDTVIQLDENQQGLKAGMPANVNIIINRRENILTLAKSAVTYATGYLSNMGQNIAVQTVSTDGKGNSGSTGSSKTSGGANDGSGGGAVAPGTAKENAQKQQANVLVLDKSGNPVPRQVVLGLSDQKNYEVLEGYRLFRQAYRGNL